jgi:hypothetical protein
MTDENGTNDDDAALDAALRELPVPPLPAELSARLQSIPQHTNVRRFPVRKMAWSAFGWAAAAAVGLLLGAQSVGTEASGEAAALEAASGEASGVANDWASEEDEAIELAIGSFAEFEEEP